MPRVTGSTPAPMSGSDAPLASTYDVALLDLDGVVYVGPHAVPHAAAALKRARDCGMRLAFVTNNAARPPAAVAHHLTELGIAAEPAEVVTSAQAAAHFLADRLPAGSRVLVVGTTGLYEALTERGLSPVPTAEDDIAAVVQGYSPTLDWSLLAEGAIAIGRGLPWVATNLDPTVPSPRGPLPGNGSLVAALRHATGAEPVVTGKPQPTMHQESVQRSGAQRPLVVGDRLDTDIEGANAVGCASLLVLTGVSGARELLAAPPARRPTYVGANLQSLLHAHPRTEDAAGGVVTCGEWRVTQDGDNVILDGSGDRDEESSMNAVRALCVAAWKRGAGDQQAAPAVVARSDAAQAVLDELGLGGEKPGQVRRSTEA